MTFHAEEVISAADAFKGMDLVVRVRLPNGNEPTYMAREFDSTSVDNAARFLRVVLDEVIRGPTPR